MAEPPPQFSGDRKRSEHLHGPVSAEHPNPPILPTHPQHPSGRNREQRTCLGFPTPPTDYQAVNVAPAPATRQVPHVNGSYFFRVQEREFLSQPTSFFRIRIDIDLLGNPQAIGGPYQPPRFITSHKTLLLRQPKQPSSSFSTSHSISSPLQRQSLSEHRTTQSPPQPHHSQTIPISSPVAAGSVSNHYIHHCRVTRHHPYPRPEPRNRSPRVINGDAQRCHTPCSRGPGGRREENTIE